jgi:Kef-type K+ transport system membrane component KefB
MRQTILSFIIAIAGLCMPLVCIWIHRLIDSNAGENFVLMMFCLICMSASSFYISVKHFNK